MPGIEEYSTFLKKYKKFLKKGLRDLKSVRYILCKAKDMLTEVSHNDNRCQILLKL